MVLSHDQKRKCWKAIVCQKGKIKSIIRIFFKLKTTAKFKEFIQKSRCKASWINKKKSYIWREKKRKTRNKKGAW